jgi:hypothetical protein
VLVVVFALTRMPGLMPHNFSAVYALVFCAGAFLRGRTAWWLPLGVMIATDLALNCYYRFGLGWDVFSGKKLLYLAGNYAGYAALWGLGRLFRRGDTEPPPPGWWSRLARVLTLVGGGLFGAVLFYLVTNTLSWLVNPFGNPEYVKTLEGWIRALTGGTAGWPQTWEFFRNTLTSAGLFTGLFAAAMSLSESPAEKGEGADAPEPAADAEPQPQEAGAEA